MTAPRARPQLDALCPYQAANSAGVIHNLSANEACLGPSPVALAAAANAAAKSDRYPDGSAAALRSAIAGVYELDLDRIICSAGSEELISLIVQAYVAPGDRAIHGACVPVSGLS